MAEFDLDYLKTTVSDPLTKALVQLSIYQPEDAVEFVANYLLNHVENLKREQKQEGLQVEHIRSQLDSTEKEQIRQKHEKESHAKNLMLEAAESAAIDFMLKSEEIEELPLKLFDLFEEVLNVKNIYIGKRETNSAGVHYLRWMHASKTSSDMIEKSLIQGKGVTFSVWDEVSDIPSEEGKPPIDKLSYLHIKNVIRDERIEFFGIPRLGEYLAIPLVYEGFLNAEALDIPEINELDSDATRKTVYSVVCINTMNSPKKITQNDIQKAIKWVKLYQDAILRCEKNIFIKEYAANKQRQTTLQEYQEKYSSFVTENENRIAEEVGKLTGNDHEILMETCKIKLESIDSELNFVREEIDSMQNRRISYKENILRIIDGIYTLLQVEEREYYNRTLQVPSWELMRRFLVTENILEQTKCFSTSIPTLQVDRIAKVKSMLTEVELKDLQTISIAAGVFHKWITAAIALIDLMAIQRSNE